MAIVHLNGASITDWAGFHSACKAEFGFPDFYGHNMDAWVDCLSYLRDEDGMSKFRLKPAEKLQIIVDHADILQKTAPDILEEVAFCIEGINERYADYGENPALELKLA
ncbi:Barstar (barnase inhibitor) [compost metagenome]